MVRGASPSGACGAPAALHADLAFNHEVVARYRLHGESITARTTRGTARLRCDARVVRALESLRRRHGGSAELRLLREFDPEPEGGEVPDPYYGGPEGFDRVFEMIHRSAEALLEHLESERPGG